MTSPPFFWITLSLSTLFVLAAGGRAERISIAILAIGSIASTAVATRELAVRFQSVEAGILIVDLAVLAAFALLAARSHRFWPIWVTGFQLAGVTTHGARMIAPDAAPWAYAVALAFWGYPMMAAIIIGAFRHRQRVRSRSDCSKLSSARLHPRRRPSGRGN